MFGSALIVFAMVAWLAGFPLLRVRPRPVEQRPARQL